MSFAGATHRFTLDAQLSGQLKDLVEEHQGGTLFMVLLAAFQVLLYRCTGQNASSGRKSDRQPAVRGNGKA